MNPRPFRAWAMAWVVSACVVPSLASAADTLTPDHAVRAALEVSAIAADARARLEASKGLAAETAISLYNPNLSGSASIDGLRANATLSQAFSLTGEGIYARQAAKANVRAAEALVRRALAEAAADTRRRWIQARLAMLLVDVAERAVALTTRLEHAVDAQVEVGEMSALDQRLTRLANTDASLRLVEALQARATALAELAAATGLVAEPAGELLTAASPPDLVMVPVRPDVEAQHAAVEAAELRLKRWRASVMPAVSLGVAWSIEDSQHFVGPALSMSLPVFTRNQGEHGAAKGDLGASLAMERAVEARADAERNFELERIEAVEAVFSMQSPDFHDKADLALAGIEAAYQEGEMDLPTTLLLQRQVLEGLEAGWTLRARVALARVDWMLAVGDGRLIPGGM